MKTKKTRKKGVTHITKSPFISLVSGEDVLRMWDRLRNKEITPHEAFGKVSVYAEQKLTRLLEDSADLLVSLEQRGFNPSPLKSISAVGHLRGCSLSEIKTLLTDGSGIVDWQKAGVRARGMNRRSRDKGGFVDSPDPIVDSPAPAPAPQTQLPLLPCLLPSRSMLPTPRPLTQPDEFRQNVTFGQIAEQNFYDFWVTNYPNDNLVDQRAARSHVPSMDLRVGTPDFQVRSQTGPNFWVEVKRRTPRQTQMGVKSDSINSIITNINLGFTPLVMVFEDGVTGQIGWMPAPVFLQFPMRGEWINLRMEDTCQDLHLIPFGFDLDMGRIRRMEQTRQSAGGLSRGHR